MPATWPASLPQKLNVDGNQETIPDGRLKSQTDTGPGKIRPRSSAMARPLSGSMNMTGAQVATLDSFVASDLVLGSLPFIFPVTRGSGTWLVRFVTLPGWSNVAPNIWTVTLALEVLP